jgi:hypothetical protein
LDLKSLIFDLDDIGYTKNQRNISAPSKFELVQGAYPDVLPNSYCG